MKWMIWSTCAALVFACGEPSPPPSALLVDALPAPPDAYALDARSADAGIPDMAAIPRFERQHAPACAPPPIRVHDRVAWSAPGGLEIGDVTVDWPVGGVPLSVVGAPGRSLDAAQIFATLATPTGCSVRAFDDAGAQVWEHDLPGIRCTGAALGDAHLVQPVIDADGPALWVLALADGMRAERIALPAPPTTAPAFGGLDANGGSHWYVGAGTQLVRYTPSAGAIAALPIDLEARAVAVASPAHAIVVGHPMGAPGAIGDGLGAAAQRVQVGADWRVEGAPLALPGAAWAPPVTLPPCPKLEANGGSHWWCGEGMFALAGDGWSGAWSLLDGRAFYLEDQLDPGLRVTGLAVGRDGLVYNGGSHWATGAWTIFGLHPLQGRPIAEGMGPAEACVQPPLLDSDGMLRARIGALDLGYSTTAGGLPDGWARAGGDAAGRGRAVTFGCVEGAPALSTRVHRQATRLMPTAVGRLGDDLLLAGVDGVLDQAAIWVARVAPDGVFRWAERVPALGFVDPQAQLPLAIVPRGEDELRVILPGDFMTTLALTVDGGWRGAAQIGDNGRGRQITVVSAGPPDLIVAGIFADAQPGEDQHWVLPYVDGFLGAQVPLRAATRVSPTAVATLAPGWVIGGIDPAGAIVRAVDAAGAERWQIALPRPVGGNAKVVDVAVTADEKVFALIDWIEVTGPEIRLVVVDGPTGVVEADSRIPGHEPARLALSPDGGGHYLTTDLRLGRVASTGAILPPVALPQGERAVGILAQDAGSVVVGLTADDGLVIARTDADGHASCEAAGRCVTTGACAPAEDACAQVACRPRDGACVEAPLADEAPCGAGAICIDGICVP